MKKSNRNEMIISLFEGGLSQAEIAQRYNLSRQRIEQIIKKRKGVHKSLKKYILKRDIYTCQAGIKCNRDFNFKNRDLLDIHHIDFDPSNDSIDNLITLCKDCHKEVHILNRDIICQICKKERPTIYTTINSKNISLCDKCHKIMKEKNKRWSLKFDKCIYCGSNNSPHYARGMCRKCLAKKRYKENNKYFKEYYKTKVAPNKEKLKIRNHLYYLKRIATKEQ